MDPDAFYEVVHSRRDVRSGFRPGAAVDDAVLRRVLDAAHAAPSVGFSQPWDFLVVRDRALRERVQAHVAASRAAYAATLPGARAAAFRDLKVEAILDAALNIAVTCDPTRGGRHTLGRHTQPRMAPYSTVGAVQNLWLAARAEGLGVGWVSFGDERVLAGLLGLPPHLEVVAYLCVGPVTDFATEPELAAAGWAQRRPLRWAVHHDTYGRRGLPGEEPMDLLDETVAAIVAPDGAARAAATERLDRMTKPRGSLGRVEDVAVTLAGIAGSCPPAVPEPAAVAVFAADHGVHAQGVSPWPQEVTAQMVGNFVAGGAVVNAFARRLGAEVCVVDVGVAAPLAAPDAAPVPGLLPRRIADGTADMTAGPALTREQAQAAVEVGIETARDLVAAGNRCLVTGDMGIANTTAAAALICAFTGSEPGAATGRGTGIDDATLAHKTAVVAAALARHDPDPADPVGVLAAFGGLEHAALAGFVLGAAALRVPVLLDGVNAGAAALVAAALAPAATGYCVAGHRSAEPGHAVALAQLRLEPLLDLGMRLGEGSGALLALPVLQAAAQALQDVATFDAAGVADKEGAEQLRP
ncbi:nicotinate-nucleotide--dimethylbenzimidazole phosphoribosyltransferase [Pseudonocardia xinjiangensis]|uniref:nicotinate-nucleotide--dimethylbenzimidazole phosphoribosyltransferase n=1 Tax=Pseudonocardia xinjiangensis TaxID=75289 RepID=UPI003D91C057